MVCLGFEPRAVGVKSADGFTGLWVLDQAIKCLLKLKADEAKCTRSPSLATCRQQLNA